MTREGHTWAEKERGQVITKKKTYVEQLLKNVVEQVNLLTFKWITIEGEAKFILYFGIKRRLECKHNLSNGRRRTETSHFAEECGEPS